MFGCSFGFIESLQSSVVSLIKTPGLDDGNVMAFKNFSNVVEGSDSSLKDGGETNVEGKVLVFQQLAGIFGFLNA